jgi:hypothetical protein
MAIMRKAKGSSLPMSDMIRSVTSLRMNGRPP